VLWAKKWTKIGPNHRAKVMFFTRTQKKLPENPTNLEKGSPFQASETSICGF